MKICSHHLEVLRTACAAQGLDVRNSVGHYNPFFKAQSMIISRAIEEYPELVDRTVCPICFLITPSWLNAAAKAIAQANTTVADGEYQRNPS